jgi:hypothetical protein
MDIKFYSFISNENSKRELVIEFVSEVEKFYKERKPKEIPEDEFDRKGYEAFWKEWNILKQKIKK